MSTTRFADLDPMDLLAVTRALVDTPSISLQEDELCSALHEWIPTFRADAELTRIKNTLIVKIGHRDGELPIVFAGHIDTVPVAEYNGSTNDVSTIDGDKLYGLGTSDMKSGVAVMIALLTDISQPSTFIFYEAEEIADEYNGLRYLAENHPEHLAGKWAILHEPTNGGLEMGCQGAVTIDATFHGQRAHAARPWMGENAIHKLENTLVRAIKASQSQPQLEVQGLTYTSTLQITKMAGGVADNVIPDRATLTVNHRFIPSVSRDEAESYVIDLCSEADEISIESISSGAMPAFDHPLFEYAKSHNKEIIAKVGWTDVARFYALGVPAVNCGPGDSSLCHRADEYIEITKLQETYEFLKDFLASL
jgi:succinyl-diaminopimelate desuccinylase